MDANRPIPSEIKDVYEELRGWIVTLYKVLQISQKSDLNRDDEWLGDADFLLWKVVAQGLTILYLMGGTRPAILGVGTTVNFFDNFSIYAIVRSVWESCLVFYYVFVDEYVSREVKEVRYKLWHASSLSHRQKYVLRTDKMQSVLEIERKRLSQLRKEIMESEVYQVRVRRELCDVKKFEAGRRFDWKPKGGWRGIARESLSAENYWVDIYNMLSATIHSNAEVIHQMRNAINGGDVEAREKMGKYQLSMIKPAVDSANIALSLFVDGCAKLFEDVKLYVDRDKELVNKIELAKGIIRDYGGAAIAS